jgi:hypothetical protein
MCQKRDTAVTFNQLPKVSITYLSLITAHILRNNNKLTFNQTDFTFFI